MLRRSLQLCRYICDRLNAALWPRIRDDLTPAQRVIANRALDDYHAARAVATAGIGGMVLKLIHYLLT